MPFAVVPFLLLTIPILEIAVFILVGREIGLWPTLGFVLLTAVAGSVMLRWQGLATVNRLRADLAAQQIPARALGDGALLIVAGLLLLTPGFVTDAIGFSLFLPPVRNALYQFLASRVNVAHFGHFEASSQPSSGAAPSPGNRDSRKGDVVDLDESEFSSKPKDPNSPWTG